MNHPLTLDQVTPRMSLKKKGLLGALALITVAVLVVTWVWCGINPFEIYNKRQNAFDYLFGRQLTEQDMAGARVQAERLPDIMAYEDAYQAIKAENRASGKTMDSMTMQREAKKRATAHLEAMTPEERAQQIEDEYERLADQKRGGYFPPETRTVKLVTYFRALIETVAIAIWGTLFAFVWAVPISMFAARNTLALMIQGDRWYHKLIHWLSQFVVRRILDFCRGFNEFVMALIFVAVIGLGPYAGVLALWIHTFGILGKVFSEAIEQIESGQVEAVLASGAGRVQTMAFAVMPQIMPLVISYTLLRFESNVRSATILGFVGAGGIGFLMFDKINGYLYREVCTMMIMVIITVTVLDYLCAMLRKRFV